MRCVITTVQVSESKQNGQQRWWSHDAEGIIHSVAVAETTAMMPMNSLSVRVDDVMVAWAVEGVDGL